jgi:hypothetical protein
VHVCYSFRTGLEDCKRHAERAWRRRELRLKYPGFGSLKFEILFHLVIANVVGWDMRKNRATDIPGVFGKCVAIAVAYEEQGRLTIHGHVSV